MCIGYRRFFITAIRCSDGLPQGVSFVFSFLSSMQIGSVVGRSVSFSIALNVFFLVNGFPAWTWPSIEACKVCFFHLNANVFIGHNQLFLCSCVYAFGVARKPVC